VKVRGFTYGIVEGRSPDRCALAAACSDTLAQIEAIWYETFWKERHFHYRKLLAAQERTILTLLYFRWKRPTIADALHISKRTVDTHCRNVFDKLDAHDKTEAIDAGKELGLFLHLL
jgi:DNA-binding NarL/FixJ family response regulator